jgi:hypothetical protein
VPNWTGGMVSTSDDDDDDGQPIVATNNTHLRKCLLCNIEVKKRTEI